MGRFLCAKGHNPLIALTSLSNLSITLCHSGPGFALRIQRQEEEEEESEEESQQSEEGRSQRTKSQRSQVKNGQKRSRKKSQKTRSQKSQNKNSQTRGQKIQAEFPIPDEASRQRPSPNLDGKRFHSELHGPAHCRNEHMHACVHVRGKRSPPQHRERGRVNQAGSSVGGWGGLQRGSNVRGVLPQCRAAHGAHTLLRLEGRETNRRARKMIKKKKGLPQLENEELLTSLMKAARPWDRGPCGEELIQILFHVKRVET